MCNKDRLDRWLIACGVLAVVLAAALTAACMYFAVPEQQPRRSPGLSADYVDLIFDDSYVHEIDIQLPQVNWDYMVKFAQEEQYVLCNLVIDGEKVENASIRPKGNSSLSAIKSQADDHFSFKIEFDHEKSSTPWHGLDKLSLNNLGQDVSCMKDFLVYHMMNEAGIPAPLSSYVHLKLNGEDFGLYLAVEAIEDSFALRNYGDDFGNLYKPECFAMADLGAMVTADGEIQPEQFALSDLGPGDRVDLLGMGARIPFEAAFGDNMKAAALQYVGPEEQRYQVFYDSAVFDLTAADKSALIDAIRTLNENPREAVDYDKVIPYFVVHNFVDNYDSYTGIFDHNYYLREAGGKLSMIPWDYNLAFGVFTMESAGTSILGEIEGFDMSGLFGDAMDDKTNMVNYPIDTPTFTVGTDDRPLLAAVLKDEQALAQYHEAFDAFLSGFFDSGKFEAMYTRAWNNIAPYVRDNQTFYTYDRFVTASEAIHDFCLLRAESVRRQLDGTLPATAEGQSRDYENLVNASHLNLASSVTFDGILMGITSDDIRQILGAIAGDNPNIMEGTAQTAAQLAENPGLLPALIGKVFASSPLLQRLIFGAVKGPILLVLSIVILVIARKRVIGYRRRRR